MIYDQVIEVGNGKVRVEPVHGTTIKLSIRENATNQKYQTVELTEDDCERLFGSGFMFGLIGQHIKAYRAQRQTNKKGDV